jgi:hypothetical protein
MLRSEQLRALGFSFALLAVPACGDDESTADHGDHGDAHVHDDGHAHGDSQTDAGDEEFPEEPCTPQYPEYREGLTAMAGDLTVRLLGVSPAPPRQKTPNDWVFAITRADGTPASGVTLANPDSYMPAHNHHGRTPPKLGTSSAPGAAALDDIDFKMRGPWEVNFDVVPAGAAPIPTTFRICVQ